MSKTFDQASDLEALHREWALANQRQKSTLAATSAYDCEKCGDPIPEARRAAVIGCRCCIDCQTEMERYGKTHFT